jgi:hypothetical protein
MADKRISQLVERTDIANNDVVPIVASGATTTNKATISSIQEFMQENLDLGVTSVGITLGTTGTDVSVSGSPITTSGNITINIPTASATNRGLLSAADWTTFNNKQAAGNYVTLDTAQTITAQKVFTTSGSSDTMIISHGSGNGFALDVIKAGNNEAIRVTKTSGSGNAMSITGGNFSAQAATFSGILSGTTASFSNSVTITADGGGAALNLRGRSADNLSNILFFSNVGSTLQNYIQSTPSNLGINSQGNTPITFGTNLSGGGGTRVTIAGSGTTTFLADARFDKYIRLKHDEFLDHVSGYSTIGSNANNFFLAASNNKYAVLNVGSLTIQRTYTLPDSSGTIALTSDLGAYLPLTGGTLTGALNGTSASFTGAVAATGVSTNAALSILLPSNANATIISSTGSNTGFGWKLQQEEVSTGDWRIFRRESGVDYQVLNLARSTGAATFSSSVTSSLGSSGANFNSNAATTGSVNAYRVSHSNGIGSFGLEANAGGDLMIGGLANATLLQSVSNTPLQLGTNQTARLTILQGGNVGIGTPSPGRLLTLYKSSTPILQFVDDASGTGSSNGFLLYIGGVNAYLENISNGFMSFQNNGAERMRITSGGYTKSTNSGIYDSVGGSYHEAHQNATTYISVFTNTNTGSSGVAGILIQTAAVANTSNVLIDGYVSGAYRFVVYSNGNVVNTNGSYGSISDIKLKENITDATPKLDDLLKVKVRNYNLIGEETKQIGVIAQELEEVFPSMIDESEDFEEVEVPQLDEEGNEVLNEEDEVVTTKERVSKGTTTKSVKYSVFVPMLIKAIQEQQEIINEMRSEIDSLKTK